MSPRLVVIVGPTGAGKTQLALALARQTRGEIVSADSQQVYRGMDIGTGKASAAERAEIPHHLLDVVDPDEDMTAARFAALADAAIAGCAARAAPVIVCGGTGLYVRILLHGLFDAPPADAALRAALAEVPMPELHARLAAIDPAAAAKIDATDRRRTTRALEVHAATGVPMSEHQARHDFRTLPSRYPARLVGLAPPAAVLYPRIDARVDQMMADGLLAEVEALRARGVRPPLRSQQAIGYAELHDYLDGVHDLARAVELIKRNSRRYARRQRTWYRDDARVEWSEDPARVDLDSLERYLGLPDP